MTHSPIQTLDSGEFSILGDLLFSTVNDVLEAFEKLLPSVNTPEMVIDLAPVDAIDSAGMVFLLEAQEIAAKHQHALHFRHLSPSLISLANVSNATDLISTID